MTVAQSWRVKHQRSFEAEPFDAAALERLAFHYVARYATTRARLSDYLKRKCRQRGTPPPDPANLDQIVSKMVDAGFVNDEAYAEMRTGALLRRGYGARRISRTLTQAGIARETTQATLDQAPLSSLEAAYLYAKRRKIGPYTTQPPSPKSAQRAIAALLRAGHSYEDVQTVLSSRPDNKETVPFGNEA